nr:protein doublesex like [Tanacetum cinerariifolium]
KSTLSLLKSPRDPREAMALVRLECGVFIFMFVMQICVLCLSYGANWGRVTEYEPEMKTGRVAEESIKAKEMENMKIDIQV